ncbi:hypothetical protein JCM10207_001143 [Rhodosporidiobolus poonsookiae]
MHRSTALWNLAAHSSPLAVSQRDRTGSSSSRVPSRLSHHSTRAEEASLNSPFSPPPTRAVKLSGFQDDDDAGFGSMLNPGSTVFGTSSTYSAFGAPQDDDDLSTNPFADLASSSYAPARPESPFGGAEQESAVFHSAVDPEPEHDAEPESPFQAEAPLPPPVPIFEPSTPVSPELSAPPRAFAREAAPEPETPLPTRGVPGDPDAFTYNPYASSPPRSSFYSPASPTAAVTSPFDTASSHILDRSKPDLSALLGEEKPPLPTFKRSERAEGGGTLSKSAVLPVSSVGRKPVGGALAALLGMGAEDDSEASGPRPKLKPAASAAKHVVPSRVGAEPAPSKVEQPPATPVAPAVAEEAPLPPDETSTPAPPNSSALDTPLPPSPSAATAADAASSSKPALRRTSSEAPSAGSVESSGPNVGYESMVSPLETGETPREDGGAGDAWPANKAVAGLDEQLASLSIEEGAPAHSPSASISTVAAPVSSSPSSTSTAQPAAADSSYQQYIFSDNTSASVSEASDVSRRPSSVEGIAPVSRGFRTFNASSDDGGFGGTDDADSLRGTYSRSVEVGEAEDAESAATSLPTATGAGDEVQRKEREGSAPLPPLPPAVPSIQGSPRSTELGGSLGPTFIITVGDPQTVGSALNLAAQHTVYTVRTRTTSSAFRKSDFSVLRRYSHFVWLYEALTQNNPGVIVPGMPEKHAIGRFGSEFVENRRLGLQAALMKIVSHPMLVGDPDLRLFLESDTFHIDIKQRKIDTVAENKGFLANLSSSISGPKFVEHDEYFEQRKQNLDAFETQLRGLITSLSAAAKARAALQSSIAELQSAFLALAQSDLSSTLRKLFDQAAAVQGKIHALAEAQSAHEEQIGGLFSVAESYARLCASARGVFGARIKAYHTYQTADSNFRKMHTAHEKAKRSGRTHSELLNLSVAEIADDGGLRLVFGNQAERKMLDAKHEFDDVSKLTKAEMARFDKEKVDDFKKALEDYAESLAARQRQVVEAWQQYHDLLVKAVEANSSAASAPSTAPTPA